MHDISSVDKNFALQTNLNLPGLKLFDVRESPFKIYGLYKPETDWRFRRMPQDIAEAAEEGVGWLNTNTSGGRVRFKTDSPYVAIKSIMPNVSPLPHMPLLGSAGFDLYETLNGKSHFCGSFIPPETMTDGYESVVHFQTSRMRDLTINFPLYNHLDTLYVGLDEKSALLEGGRYTTDKPVLFYGSSITQGGCASRPGNCYQGFLSRELDCDYINLGFSGNGRAQDPMIDYISTLDVSVFVCDYDHNSPSVEHLSQTHPKLFGAFRAAHPDTPVIFISKPDSETDPDTIARRAVIYKTYSDAKAAGDERVWFINGGVLFGEDCRDSCTVDGIHPNDLGFFRMAKGIVPVLKEALGL